MGRPGDPAARKSPRPARPLPRHSAPVKVRPEGLADEDSRRPWRPAGSGNCAARSASSTGQPVRWRPDGREDPALLDVYARAAGRPLSATALSLHRLRWGLAGIAVHVDTLRHDHRRSEDTTASPARLADCPARYA